MACKKTIIIAGKDEKDRKNLTSLLREDYNILEADGSGSAMEIMEENTSTAAAAILDITFNIQGGIKLLSALKRKENISKIPIIVITGKSDEKTELAVLEAGASDYIHKPFNFKVLKKRLENIIKWNENIAVARHIKKDNLTGVYTEEIFCKKVVKLLKENSDTSYAFVYSDMENFRLIRDLFGENAANNILVYLAKVFNHFIGRDELCGRFDAGHFVLFLKYNKKELDRNLESAVKIINDFPINMTIKLGFGVYKIEDRNMPVQAMCARAVMAADAVRGKYGQHVAYYDKKVWEKQLHEQEIVNCMEDAVKEKQFKVYFQPKYELDSEMVAGAEALVRWQHPEKGFMSPAEFIPLFEKNGFITELDKFVWDTACGYIENWIKKGYHVVPISVNVSRADIYNPDFIEIMLGIVNRHGIAPEYIHLEITETAYTDNPAQIIDVVKKLKDIGFVIEMDDFGSGYSSLNMLNELPVDILKLDMGFVQGGIDENSSSILSFIIGLAKWMDYAVVAEGIETEEQIQILKDMDCNFVQGYYYAKPMPPDEFEAYMLKHNIPDNHQ